MRCECCNKTLSNVESTRKFSSGAYVDMCNKCLSTIQDAVTVVEPLVDEDSYDEDN